MRLILLGAPGSGKGTQATVLNEKLGVPHISTGDIFRANIKNGTELGKKAKEYIDKGQLVPDEVTIGIVKDRLAQADCDNGFILDGFPRTIPQAKYLDNVLAAEGIEIDAALNIYVPDETIVRRMSGRRVCPGCGSSFHLEHKLPKQEGKCDSCGVGLVQRDDDRAETVLKRLNTYHKDTEPLLDYYGEKGILVTVQGQEDVAHTTQHVFESLGISK